MITPDELAQVEPTTNGNKDIDELIEEIDAEIKANHLWYNMYDFAILTNEYPKQLRNEIAQRYKDSGWEFVDHRTSSELGERPGLTEFRFSKYPISW